MAQKKKDSDVMMGYTIVKNLGEGKKTKRIIGEMKFG